MKRGLENCKSWDQQPRALYDALIIRGVEFPSICVILIWLVSGIGKEQGHIREGQVDYLQLIRRPS